MTAPALDVIAHRPVATGPSSRLSIRPLEQPEEEARSGSRLDLSAISPAVAARSASCARPTGIPVAPAGSCAPRDSRAGWWWCVRTRQPPSERDARTAITSSVMVFMGRNLSRAHRQAKPRTRARSRITRRVAATVPVRAPTALRCGAGCGTMRAVIEWMPEPLLRMGPWGLAYWQWIGELRGAHRRDLRGRLIATTSIVGGAAGRRAHRRQVGRTRLPPWLAPPATHCSAA